MCICAFSPQATSLLKNFGCVRDQAFGGCSSRKEVRVGLKRGFTISEVSSRTRGRSRQGHSCIQGMLPLDDRAGVVE